MKEISIEQKTYIRKWEAKDGTQFSSKEDCEKYENSAKCVILANYKDFVVKVSSEYDIFGVENEDCEVDVVRVPDERAVDVIFQTFCFFRDWVSDENKEEVRKKIVHAYEYNDFLLIQKGYESDDFYIIGTLYSILEQIKERVKPDEI